MRVRSHAYWTYFDYLFVKNRTEELSFLAAFCCCCCCFIRVYLDLSKKGDFFTNNNNKDRIYFCLSSLLLFLIYFVAVVLFETEWFLLFFLYYLFNYLFKSNKSLIIIWIFCFYYCYCCFYFFLFLFFAFYFIGLYRKLDELIFIWILNCLIKFTITNRTPSSLCFLIIYLFEWYFQAKTEIQQNKNILKI